MDSSAKWIRTDPHFGDMSPEFKKKLTFRKPLVRAVAYVSALGLYHLFVDGKKIGRACFAPGLTSYYNRVQLGKYDLTDVLQNGSEVSVRCGKGWAVGSFGFQNKPHTYVDHISAIADIELCFADGTTAHFGTDDTWEVYTTPILDSEIYHGETKDLTTEIKCVGRAVLDTVGYRLVEQVGEDVVEQEVVLPQRLLITPQGDRVIDFGQNLAGYVEIRVKGNRGDRIVIDHAEVLDRDGNFYTENLRRAKNVNTYVLSGNEDVCKPEFSFQGYRYIRLLEYPFEEIELSCFRSIAVYSNIKPTCRFACGNEKLNRLYQNILWGQRSNFLDIPTDCPQRDERLGWTGDAQVFCRTAAINYDVERFFAKWLGDMVLDQTEEGIVWGIVPTVPQCATKPSAAWGDAATVCPWEMYLAYGNRELLRQHYPMMQKWVDYIHKAGEEEFLWIGGDHFGDWLAMDAGEGVLMGATQTDLIASAYFAYSTSLLIKAGKVLEKDVSSYEELYQNIRKAFHRAFVKDGLPVIYPKADAFSVDRPVKGCTQTAIALILRFELYETEQERRLLTDMLVELIEQNGNCMTTGFVGTPHILHALSENGRADVAYRLLLQEKNPSWLFSVDHGATTVWEHWDCQKEDGSFWSAEMNSFNHYAYGAVFDWIFGVCCGIKPMEAAPAYKEITLAPQPLPALGFAKTAIQTRNGEITSYWHCRGDRVEYEFTVPQGVTAHLTLPSGYTVKLQAGVHQFSE